MPSTYRNLPEDWDSFYHNCAFCGARYHASEGCECQTESETDDGGPYEVVVIDPSGPGRVLASFEGRHEAYNWAEDVANNHSLGVAIHDLDDDTFDCEGEGEFAPRSECWASSGGE